MVCGVHCPQNEHQLGQGQAGAEEDKLYVRVLYVGQQLGNFPHLLNFELKRLPYELGIIQWLKMAMEDV